MPCEHKKWVYPPDAMNDWTGEMERQEPYEVFSQVDISIGAFKCTQCGEVGYCTGLWRKYYEEGTPCFGSENVSRNLK